MIGTVTILASLTVGGWILARTGHKGPLWIKVAASCASAGAVVLLDSLLRKQAENKRLKKRMRNLKKLLGRD